jgi:hypothetical protein
LAPIASEAKHDDIEDLHGNRTQFRSAGTFSMCFSSVSEAGARMDIKAGQKSGTRGGCDIIMASMESRDWYFAAGRPCCCDFFILSTSHFFLEYIIFNSEKNAFQQYQILSKT